MERLTYLVNWGKNKETAWSGTNYSLYKALSKYYLVNDIDLKFPKIISIFLHRVLRLDWFGGSFYELLYFRRKYRGIKGKVLQMSGIVDSGTTTQSYIYNDLSVSYVEYMREHLPEIFAVSDFQHAKPSLIHQQASAQAVAYEKCTAIFCMGHWLRDFLVHSGLSANKVIYCGGGTNVDFSLIKPQQKTGNKLLFVGKDFKRKGGFITYEAFKLLRNQGEDVELYVAGPSENPIKNPVKGYHFVGQVKYDEVAELFNKCDVFCMPSYFEAYGLVFIEALTFGLPCIGRNSYEMPYFIDEGKTGLLLKNDNPRELSGLMLKLLKDKTYKEIVRQKHDFYISEYSWDAVARRMKEVMDFSVARKV